MTYGPATALALAAALLALLGYIICSRLKAPDWLTMAVFGFLLALVIVAGRALLQLP